MYMYIHTARVTEEIYFWFHFLKNLKNESADEED